jgi:uncharacterized protein YfaP (DUF2135 family)
LSAKRELVFRQRSGDEQVRKKVRVPANPIPAADNEKTSALINGGLFLTKRAGKMILPRPF